MFRKAWGIGLLLIAVVAWSEEWVADLFPHPRLLPKEAQQARIALPEGFAAGRELSLALRSVDVFGNVSAPSNVITGRMPPKVGGQPQPEIPGLVTPPSPVTGQLEPLLPAPTDLRVQLDPSTGLLVLSWTPARDPELVGYQLLRNAAAAPLAPPPPDPSEIRELAVWDFPAVGENQKEIPPEAWKAVRHHEAIEPPAIVRGPGLQSWGNQHYNQHAISIHSGKYGDDADAPDRYLGITLTPRPGKTLALARFMVGLWRSGKDNIPQYRLEYSLDSFKTRNEVPLVLQGEFVGVNMTLGTGVPAIADLSAIPALQNVKGPVEFRIFMWGITGRGIGKLGRPAPPPPRDDPDLIIEGAVR